MIDPYPALRCASSLTFQGGVNLFGARVLISLRTLRDPQPPGYQWRLPYPEEFLWDPRPDDPHYQGGLWRQVCAQEGFWCEGGSPQEGLAPIVRAADGGGPLIMPSPVEEGRGLRLARGPALSFPPGSGS